LERNLPRVDFKYLDLGTLITIIDPFEDIRWDQFVLQHPLAWLCHFSGWKKVLEDSFPQMKGIYLVKWDSCGQSIQAGLPLFFINSKLTGKRLVSIPFATLSDPLIMDNMDAAELIKASITICQALKADHLEVRATKSEILDANSALFARRSYKHHSLDVSTSPDELMKRFDRTCVRQRISRALKSTLSLKIAESEDDLRTFYKLYLITRKRVHLPPQPFIFFQKLWDIFSHVNMITLLLAQLDGQSIAGLMLFKHGNRISAEIAASDDHYKGISPNHFLFWAAIQLAHEEGRKVFDFGRTSPKNATLMHFKSHWGAKISDLTEYYYYEKQNNKSDDNEDKLSHSAIRIISTLLPMNLYQLFGNFCYRHLG